MSRRTYVRHRARSILAFLTPSAELGWATVGVLVPAGVLVAAGVCWACAFSEDSFRWMGNVLQLFGVGTVVWGIRKTRAQFGIPPYFSLLRERANTLLFLRSSSASIEVTLPMPSLEAYGRSGLGSLPPNATLENRVAALEARVGALNDGHFELMKSTSERLKQASDQAAQEMQLRIDADQKIEEQLREASTGGIAISLVGATWLFFGVVAAGFGPELARLLR